MKIYLPSTFILRYVRAKMIVDAFIIELDGLDYWDPRKHKDCEILCTKSMESCSLVISQILAEFRLERVTYKTLRSLKRIIKICLKFYCWVSKNCFLLMHPIHIIVWGNFPFKPNCTYPLSNLFANGFLLYWLCTFKIYFYKLFKSNQIKFHETFYKKGNFIETAKLLQRKLTHSKFWKFP